MESIERRIAEDLLKINAVFFRPDEPFTWASGIISPVYCDNRLTLSDPEVRKDVENSLAETVRKYYPDAEALMGTSTAGIAHAAITAYLMGLPMGYVGPYLDGRQRSGGCGNPEGGRCRSTGYSQYIHLRDEEGPGTAA